MILRVFSIKFCVYITFMCFVAKNVVYAVENIKNLKIGDKVNKNEEVTEIPVIKVPGKIVNPASNNNNTILENQDHIKNNNNRTIQEANNKKLPTIPIENGAFLRGFYVILGLSVLGAIYFIIRSYKLSSRKKLTKIVHKYGVRANRTDGEMIPLPLIMDDDQDDDTIFDLTRNSS